MRSAITGARLIDPESRNSDYATILFRDGRIESRQPAGEAFADEGTRVLDRPGLYLAPGFIDLHFHGALVSAAPEQFQEAVRADARRMLREGTTAFLATTLCWPEDSLVRNVEAAAQASELAEATSARCLGLHLEGPWISPSAPGAMDTTAIAAFGAGGDRVLAAAGDRLRMVTLAPEIEGAGRLLDSLAKRDCVASLGHSTASRDQIERGIERGLRHVTHLWNAMGPTHHREPGVALTVLGEEALSCDLICDGHHVHPSTLRASARALGERLLLITDRVAAGDADSALGEVPEAAPGEPYRRADGTLAGSQLGMDGALANSQSMAGLSLPEAVAACTLRPARLLGVEHERGSLRAGAVADFVLLDGAGRVVETWRDGSLAWSAAREQSEMEQVGE